MEKTYSAKTLEEAKEKAYSEFEAQGALRDDVEFIILEQPVKKLFGTKGEYKITAIWNEGELTDSIAEIASAVENTSIKSDADDRFEDEDEDRAGYEPESDAPAAEESVETLMSIPKVSKACDYIRNVLDHLGAANFTITPIRRGDDTIVLDIEGNDLGMVIGRRGENLDALQYLTILAANRSEANTCKISIDCCGYRAKRKEALETLAVKTAKKVVRTGRRVTLEPMNPYERRLIHSKVAEIEGATSRSTGDEPFRKVIIASTAPRSASGNRRGSGGREYRSYKQSSGFSTSFEREYKRKEPSQPQTSDYSKETEELEKSASLYGKIEL